VLNATNYGFIMNSGSYIVLTSNLADGVTGTGRAYYLPAGLINGTVVGNVSLNAATPFFKAGTKETLKSNLNSWNPSVWFDDAAPTTGTWAAGDIVYDTTPSAGGHIGWICVTAGTPGTWKTFGAITA
jgi:hypothetical protein